MRDQLKNYPVNWIDGMKINKNLFIAQDDAVKSALYDVASLHVSPVRYGILPPSVADEETFVTKISVDNQNTLRASVLACQAITSGGVRINLLVAAQNDIDGVPATSFKFIPSSTDAVYWIALVIHPFKRNPFGSLDMAEMPPRFPYVSPTYELIVVDEIQYEQFASHPYALIIGKVLSSGNIIRVDDEYIPPCFSVSAHPNLMVLYSNLDSFLGELEINCAKIVQMIFIKELKHENAQLVQFLCDRMILYISSAITDLRWGVMHESPAKLIATAVGLARIIKNAIDFRIGSGKDELMKYFSDWCNLKPGEMEIMLTKVANVRYDNNDINKNVSEISLFIDTIRRLFKNLVDSELKFMKDGRIIWIPLEQQQPTPDRREERQQPGRTGRFSQ